MPFNPSLYSISLLLLPFEMTPKDETRRRGDGTREIISV